MKDRSSLWAKSRNKVNPKPPLFWASESDVKRHVHGIMEDLTQEVGMDVDLLFVDELSLFEKGRSDIWIVSYFGVPVGVIEVKIPKRNSQKSPLDDEFNLGQLFDYVSHLRTYLEGSMLLAFLPHMMNGA